MIGRITGTLAEKSPPLVLVDVGGVGYEVDVPMSTFYNLPGLGERVFNLVYFQQLTSPVPAPAPVAGYIQFANGIIGAVMAGWMFTVIMLARGPFLAGQALAWRTIAYPLAGWYAVDTAFSIAHGVWGNVLLNTGTALMFGIPLVASRKHFRTTP